MAAQRVAIVLAVLGLAARVVAGFGYLSFPPATYRDLKRCQIYTSEFNSSIHPTFFHLRNFDPKRIEDRAAVFVRQLAFADFLSLREIADAVFPGCGNSIIGGGVEPVNVYNATHLLWRNEEEKFGFYAKGGGPCETWIDNTRVHFRDNCVHSYSTYPAKIPIDFRQCRPGRVCELRFYWVAATTAPLKLMKHCVRIVNDPFRPAAKENTDPLKNVTTTTCGGSSFSIDLTVTWEKIWLDDDDTLSPDPSTTGTTILVLP